MLFLGKLTISTVPFSSLQSVKLPEASWNKWRKNIIDNGFGDTSFEENPKLRLVQSNANSMAHLVRLNIVILHSYTENSQRVPKFQANLLKRLANEWLISENDWGINTEYTDDVNR